MDDGWPAWDTFNSFPRRHRDKATSIRDMKIADREAVDAVCEFIAGDSIALAILGQYGVGKTQLATNASKIIMQVQPVNSCRYTTIYDMFDYLKERMRRDGDASEEKNPLKRYTSTPLLVIDDINPGYGSTFERVTLHRIIDERYRKQRRHLLISNLDAKEFRFLVGEAVATRIEEDGKIIELRGPNRRGGRGPTGGRSSPPGSPPP